MKNGAVLYQITPGTSYAAFVSGSTVVASGTLAPEGSSTVYVESNDGNDDDITLPSGGVYLHAVDLSTLRVKGATAGDKVNFIGHTVAR